MIITEFDEQATSKNRIKVILTDKYQEFLKGDETMGVLQGYETAARNIGVTESEIEECYKGIK